MKRLLLSLSIWFLCALPLAAQGLEDLYIVLAEAAGLDPNTGQYTFLTLILPPGGQYQALGTAFTALARDSGYLEANPAGSAQLAQTELSLYHNDWIGDSRIEGLVLTLRQGDFGFGLGAKLLYLPFTGIDAWGQRLNRDGRFAKGYYTEFVGTMNVSYNFFRSFYFQGLTVGGNLKAAHRGLSEEIYAGQSAFNLLLDFGLLTRFNFLKFYASRFPNTGFGLSLRNLGAPVGGDPMPTRLVAGLAYSPLRPFTLTVDGTLPLSVSENFSLGNFGSWSAGSAAVELPHAALGLDVVFTDFLSVQGGFLFKTSSPRATAGLTMALERLLLHVNYAVDLATTTTLLDRFSLEIKLNLGDFGRQIAEDQARELYLQALELYAQGELAEAVDLLDRSLELNPQFTPAQQIRDTARRALQLQQILENLNQIDRN